jgi:hypothetical protein
VAGSHQASYCSVNPLLTGSKKYIEIEQDPPIAEPGLKLLDAAHECQSVAYDCCPQAQPALRKTHHGRAQLAGHYRVVLVDDILNHTYGQVLRTFYERYVTLSGNQLRKPNFEGLIVFSGSAFL